MADLASSVVQAPGQLGADALSASRTVDDARGVTLGEDRRSRVALARARRDRAHALDASQRRRKSARARSTIARSHDGIARLRTAGGLHIFEDMWLLVQRAFAGLRRKLERRRARR